MTKMEKLEEQKQFIRERIKKLKARLKEIDNKSKELKNLEIVKMVKTLNIPPDELYKYLKEGTIGSNNEDLKKYESEDFEDD